ncbi:MAG: LLM class flavin-dependent oxidoreductase [Nocardioides sp.]|uniref:LLM class flavin-dependent oxidoreductase n=1 Tax=Nocardioides sp. TaxID=35761 RepID=UPI0039E55511
MRSDQTSADAVAASIRLARLADELGYHRYWLAEHHNMPAVAATNPPVLIGLVAGATERIRVGSGGMMLPNHAPLVVAEQFALLEAAFPGRIDLGVGRAPGTDPVTAWALRHGGPADADDTVNRFPEILDDLEAMMAPEGASVAVAGRRHELRATPAAGSAPELWLLGSSQYAAALAAQKGLPYVFAHHFAGQGTAEALDLYRRTYVPSPDHPEPRTFLTVNAAVAETADEAERLALPQLLTMLRLRTGAPLTAQQLVDDALATPIAEGQAGLLDAMRRSWIIDDASGAAKRVEALAAEFGVDEVMINPVGGAYAGSDARTAPGRELALSLLAHHRVD